LANPPDEGKKVLSRNGPGQPKWRHYGQQPLKRRDGLPVLAKQIPLKILPREMIEPLTDPQVRFLVAFWKIGHENEALAQIGYSKSGFGKWRNQSRNKEAFIAAYELMKGIIDDYWEAKAERSWDEGYEEHEDVYDKKLGEKGEWDGVSFTRRRYKTRVKRDPGILKTILSSRMPEKYGKPGQGGGGTTINVIFESVDVKEKAEVVESTEVMPVEVVDQEEENG